MGEGGNVATVVGEGAGVAAGGGVEAAVGVEPVTDCPAHPISGTTANRSSIIRIMAPIIRETAPGPA